MAHVLITKIGGGVDYSTDGEVSVVLVDLDALDQAFPDQIDQLILEVKTLPRTIPWRADILAQLVSRRDDAVRHLLPHRTSVDLDPADVERMRST